MVDDPNAVFDTTNIKTVVARLNNRPDLVLNENAMKDLTSKMFNNENNHFSTIALGSAVAWHIDESTAPPSSY